MRLDAQTCAQVLLSLGNLANRMQYLNASNTFTELFSYGTVPIVNENDTVAVEELRIGDNDTLSAQVCISRSLRMSCANAAAPLACASESQAEIGNMQCSRPAYEGLCARPSLQLGLHRVEAPLLTDASLPVPAQLPRWRSDLLCAQVATMVRADWLFLLTDVPCLYTANPSVDPSAEPIHEVRDIAALQVLVPAGRLCFLAFLQCTSRILDTTQERLTLLVHQSHAAADEAPA